ncbi:hypothetical protein [Pseudorhodobacter wandonensis]|uniref:hypothetical protein n=1 Tax=Pseudorhodobacter wandonensis TaxID=1120568 RepID=UPI0012E13D38|nr:hypothetical protein [Pseudorhodobacter wandonensis]
MALDAILDAADANGGRLDADAFWTFVAGLAQGRGITDGLHYAGLEAVQDVPSKTQNPQKAKSKRERRAYHIGVLAQLLMDVGRMPGQGSLLPGSFQHGVVAHDLLGMQEGPDGVGRGDPQILTSGRKGIAKIRQAARFRLVGVVFWRVGRTGQTQEAVWNDLMGEGDAEKSRLDRWLKEFGGAKGDLVTTAHAAGAANDTSSLFAKSNLELASTIQLVNQGSGRRKQKVP